MAKAKAQLRQSRAKNLSVKMLQDLSFSEDGINATQLRRGETYSLPRERALHYVKKELAELIDTK